MNANIAYDLLSGFNVSIKTASTNIYNVLYKGVNEYFKRRKRLLDDGFCPSCGITKTHEVQKTLVGKAKRIPMNNWIVFNGTCLSCFFKYSAVALMVSGMLLKRLNQHTPWWKEILQAMLKYKKSVDD